MYVRQKHDRKILFKKYRVHDELANECVVQIRVIRYFVSQANTC